MSMSDYLETASLNVWYRSATFTKPSNIYVSLWTVGPNEDGTGTEVTGGAYARVAMAVADASWTAPATDGTDKSITNAVAITFAAPTANWGTIVGFGIHDAVTAGNLLDMGTLDTPRTVNSGDNPPSFSVGSLKIQRG